MRKYSWLILLLVLCGALGSGCGDEIDPGEPVDPAPPVVTPIEPDNALQLEIDALVQKILLPLEHPDHVPAIEALADIGAPAVPAVLELLDHENDRVRVSAIFVFHQMGPPAAGAVPVLNELLLDTDEPFRCNIAGALGQIRDPRSIPALIQILSDVDPVVRECSAITLGHIGEAANAAVPALIEMMLNDPNDRVRSRAAIALGRMVPAAAVASPALVQTLGDPIIADVAMDTLIKIGPLAKAALLEGIADNKDNIPFFGRALMALGYTGSDEQTVEVLLQAFDHEDAGVRRNVAIALGALKEPPDVIVPALVGKLNDESLGVRDYSITSLGQIGPPAKDAVPALIKVLENSDRQLRYSAAWALMKIGTPEAVAAVQAAIEAFDDPWLEEFRQ